MIYDLVDMAGCVYCMFVVDFRNCIISKILNSISKNKVNWFKVEVVLLYIYTDGYHMTVVIFSSVIVP